MPSVTRKSSGKRAERREQLQTRLLEVVEEMLAKGESFTEISVERMVAEAGLARSTFYVYFEDKGDLLRAWFDGITADLESAAADWWALGAEATRDDVLTALTRLVKIYRPHTALMAAMYDAAVYDPAVRESVDAMMASNIAGLRKHIRAGQKEGFVDPELPAATTSEWLTWMAERGLHQLVRQASDAQLASLIESYTAIVWNTLYAPTRR